jgi:hypothetical protein
MSRNVQCSAFDHNRRCRGLDAQDLRSKLEVCDFRSSLLELFDSLEDVIFIIVRFNVPHTSVKL